jgi:uncharacterized protein (TIGR03437 family)
MTNPAKVGSIVTFYATGWQSSFAPLADGQVATGAADVCAGTCKASGATPPAPFVSTHLLAATVLYGGAAPGTVAGVTQFNVQLGAISGAPGVQGFNLLLSNPTVNVVVWATP